MKKVLLFAVVIVLFSTCNDEKFDVPCTSTAFRVGAKCKDGTVQRNSALNFPKGAECKNHGGVDYYICKESTTN